MITYNVIYSPEAANDLRSIYSYIAFELKEPGIAESLVNEIRAGIRKLDQQPERYAPVDWEPWQSMGMRKLSVKNYVAFYLVDNDSNEVNVTRIFYGDRDIESIVK